MSAEIIPFPLMRRTNLVRDYVIGHEAASQGGELNRARYEDRHYWRLKKSLIKIGVDPERARRECVAFESYAWRFSVRALAHV